jgi:hypothetical protein
VVPEEAKGEGATGAMIEAQILILLTNVGILGLTMKLYTEYYKDKAQDRRRP